MSNQELPAALQLKPIISYPREAQVGKTYLVSIDVQLATPNASWDYPEEEYTIGFILNTSPYFTCEPLHDVWPTIILHRYGGTYGPAEFLLTAADHEIERGQISITLVNGWGIPMTRLELPCEVRLESNLQSTMPEIILPSSQSTVNHDERVPVQVSSEVLEEQERVKRIAEMLMEAGWTIAHDIDTITDNCAFMEIPTSIETIDGTTHTFREIILIVNQESVGTIAVNKDGDTQKWIQPSNFGDVFSNANSPLIPTTRGLPPFIYEIQGEEIRFTNNLEPEARTRTVFHFHRPETFALWLDQAPVGTPNDLNNLLRSRLRRMPSIVETDIPANQIKAITKLEASLAQNRPRALIQMTNSSPMITSSIYRLLQYGNARRILYLVDNTNVELEKQNFFRDFTIPDTGQAFADAYDIMIFIGSNMKLDYFASSSETVNIVGIEQIYYWLFDIEEKPEDQEHTETPQTDMPIKYHSALPIEFFDIIFIVECFDELHRRYRPLLDYFDAFLVGVGGEIPSQVETLFNRNLVYQSPEMLAFKHILEGTERIENPYVPGLVLEQHDPLFVGRTELIRRLDTALSSDHPPIFFLTGERGMGKSSILKQLPILLGSRYLPIFYDIQGISTFSIAALLASIAEEVHDTLLLRGMLVHKIEYETLRDDLRENEAVMFHSFNRWLKKVERVLAQEDYVLLLMFDEFKKLAEAEQKGYLDLALLFDWFRSVIQQPSHVRLLFSGIKSITEMGTRWANYFVNVELLKVSFLEPEEARQLIMHPVQSFPGEFIFGSEVTDEILRVTGNHPFLLQAMCSVLIKRLNSLSRRRASMEDVTMAIETVLEQWGPSYFSDLWERIDSEQHLCLRAIYESSGLCDANYIQRYCNLDKVVVASHLEKLLWRDLVCREGDKYRISIPIFSRWFMLQF